MVSEVEGVEAYEIIEVFLGHREALGSIVMLPLTLAAAAAGLTAAVVATEAQGVSD